MVRKKKWFPNILTENNSLRSKIFVINTGQSLLDLNGSKEKESILKSVELF